MKSITDSLVQNKNTLLANDWQRQWLQGAVLESQLDYWKQQLSGNIPILQLPSDRPRTPVQTYSGKICRQMLPQALTDDLKALSQQSGVTLFMTLLAAFKVLLHRYTGQEDILVGSPIAGRNQVETEGLMGLFVNTLVMRTDLSGNPSFREILNQVRQVALGAYEHQDLPFEKLVEELKPERDRTHSPLFQVMFAMNPPWTKGAERELPSLKIAPTFGYTHSSTAKLDLTLVMRDTGKGFRASLEYNTDLFDEAAIARMLGHFETMLAGILANPEQRISELPLLTPGERQQLLIELNNTQTDYPRQACIHQLFEAQVESTPDAVAVVFQNEQLTYRELNSRANQLAHYLRSLGVKTNELIGICLDRSLEMVVGVLGILKAGAAYLPLDPNHPQARMAFMLEDSQVKVLLTQQRLVEFLPKHIAKLVELDTDSQFIVQEDEENLVCGKDTTPENLAYVIYTSGSTGIPKGVKVPHRTVVNLLASMREQPGLIQQDILLSVTTLSFDIAVLEIFLPLIVGATTFIVSREVATDGEKLLTALNHSKATVMQATPATWQLLLAAGWQGSQHLKILCGGEALSPALAKELVNRAQSVWNMYGPTETTVWSTCYSIPEDGIPLIGQPIANTQIYLLDGSLQPVPVGVPGEMYIGGAGITLGYLNRPELTKERFISNPFSQEPNARLYRTGDLARYRTDGNLEYLQRIDDQVKIRGFRIELGEVELALAQYPGVQQAVVIAPEVVPGEKRLVGYVVPNSEQIIAIAQLRNFLQMKLPSYMVPSAFVILDTLPLNTNGKVNRKALPIANLTNTETEKTFATAEDSLQLQLTEIWENILGIHPIGITDNFFDLGGHSLLAVRLFSQIEKIVGKNLPLSILLQAPTIEQLANIVERERCSKFGIAATSTADVKSETLIPWSSLVAIQPNGSKPPFFCVHGLGGEVLRFRELALHLGSDQPFYGLQPQGLDGKQLPYTRIEDMAAHYIQQIQAIQPHEPYFIGGYSAGGIIAYEMARQLVMQGKKVALLVLFDTYRLRKSESLPLQKPASRHWKSLLAIASNYVIEQVKGNRDLLKYKIKEILWRFVFQLHLSLGRPLAYSYRKFMVEEATRQALRKYVLQVYSGRVTGFRTEDSLVVGQQEAAPKMGWGEFALGGVDIYDISGTHNSIFKEPHVGSVSEKMKACISKSA
ncbi:non-ribosomal peptide synthetase [Nostoc sp.]|uniref:non-ribosomal peptide synthetase n=1 Tax=Nostoc sp. TaxID=1180 RepID=UPI002FF48D99